MNRTKNIKTKLIEDRDFLPREDADGLVESVVKNGVITPITVRRKKGRYVVIAGARRLAAARAANLPTVPATILDADDNTARILLLVENTAREGLNCFEQAELMREILQRGCTQKQLAARLCVSQGAIANKQRLLKFEPDQRKKALERGLSERQLRAILRLPQDKWDTAIVDISYKGLSASQTESYVTGFLEADSLSERRHPVVRDVRIFFNTITRAVEVMNRSGLGAVAIRRDTPNYIEYIIKIPSSAADGKAQ